MNTRIDDEFSRTASPKVFNGEWERATVIYPGGRRLTALWPVGTVDKFVSTGQAVRAVIHA